MEPSSDTITVVRASERIEGPSTPGMSREEAFAGRGVWAGVVTTEPHLVSGWHHHGEHDTVIYVVSGRLRMESGAHGGSVVDAAPGDFVFVPKRLIHREANPGDDRSELLGVRVGEGETLVNVDGPDDR
jgi:uncharacterized RmlC-like cupin family protein